MRWLNLLFVLLVNAVPLYGVKELGWSASTVVVLYWFENLLTVFFTCARIALHRRLTRKRGYWRKGQLGTKINDKPSTAGLLGEYAAMAIIFTLAHGIFVGGFVLIAADHNSGDPRWAFSGTQFWQGAQWMAIALVADFLVDAATIRQRSFAWMRHYVGQRVGRVILLHLTLYLRHGRHDDDPVAVAVLYVLIGEDVGSRFEQCQCQCGRVAGRAAGVGAQDRRAAKGTGIEARCGLKRRVAELKRRAAEDESDAGLIHAQAGLFLWRCDIDRGVVKSL